MPDNDKLRQPLAERLRASRENAGLSQGQVAKVFGYQRPTISEIEAGRRKVSAEELSRFSELYDVSLVWLTSGGSEFSDPTVELAARELNKLSKEDLNRLMQLIKTLRKTENK
jgi:transcriptional regulator with XRE-family HTH domain